MPAVLVFLKASHKSTRYERGIGDTSYPPDIYQESGNPMLSYARRRFTSHSGMKHEFMSLKGAAARRLLIRSDPNRCIASRMTNFSPFVGTSP